jgi:hypothetical protein
MIRNVLVAITAAVLSFLFVAFSAFLLVRHTKAGHFVSDPTVLDMDYGELLDKHGDPFVLTQQLVGYTRFLVLLAAAILVGVFVGLFAFLGVLPLQLFYLAGAGLGFSELALCIAYSGAACMTARALSRLRARWWPSPD